MEWDNVLPRGEVPPNPCIQQITREKQEGIATRFYLACGHDFILFNGRRPDPTAKANHVYCRDCQYELSQKRYREYYGR